MAKKCPIELSVETKLERTVFVGIRFPTRSGGAQE